MSSIPNFFCPDCSRAFGTVQALTAHRRVHKLQIRNPAPDGTPSPIPTPHEVIEMTFGGPIIPPHRPITVGPIMVKVKRLDHGRGLPNLEKATPGSAAVDLYAAVDKPVWLGANERANPPIPSGLAIELPEGYVAKVYPRSGLAVKHGIGLTNSVGIIDSDYRGEIMITLINHSRAKLAINRGDRVAQMIIEKVEPVQFEYVDELSQTQRGEGGLGSTGVGEVQKTRTISVMDAGQEPDGQHVRRLPANQ